MKAFIISSIISLIFVGCVNKKQNSKVYYCESNEEKIFAFYIDNDIILGSILDNDTVVYFFNVIKTSIVGNDVALNQLYCASNSLLYDNKIIHLAELNINQYTKNIIAIISDKKISISNYTLNVYEYYGKITQNEIDNIIHSAMRYIAKKSIYNAN